MADDLWKQLEQGKNRHPYKKLTKKDFLKVFNEKGSMPIKDPTRVISLYTGTKGIEAFNEAVNQDRLIELLKELLMKLYLEKGISAEEYTKIERLLISKDAENQTLGAKLLQAKYKGEIILEYGQNGELKGIKTVDHGA